VRLLTARQGPERVAAEPETVAELVARCGYLPLALAVMAARAAANPGLRLGVLAGQLASAADAEAGGGAAAGEVPGRLEVLETGDPVTSLRELLSWSYRQLSPPAVQMFALLRCTAGRISRSLGWPVNAALARPTAPEPRNRSSSLSPGATPVSLTA
jgi:hypothetical protein